MYKKVLFLILFYIFSLHSLYAESARISQIDASYLLLNQNVKLYVSVTNDNGEPVTGLAVDAFSVFESPDGINFERIDKILSFETMVNYESGINFLMLIDNSGSMYRDMRGRRTNNKSSMKISQAMNAVAYFLKSINNPKDNVGLISYNSYYNTLSGLTGDKIRIQQSLNNIKRPGAFDAFSEIYASLYTAVDEFSSTRGRKAILILSDGLNQPYYEFTKKEHRVFGKKIYEYTEPARYCQEEGISVYAIYFGDREGKKDKGLIKIAERTGGAVFDAYNLDELKGIYNKIVNQILNEYLITYSGTMTPADKKYVKVICDTENGQNVLTRFYFSSTVFGLPMKSFSILLIIPLLIAILLLWLISKIDFKKKKSDPSIQILDLGGARASTRLFTLNKKGKTVIGGDAAADMTLSGGTSAIKEKHATIVYNQSKKKYTIVADGKLTVNNKPVQTKELESGDVINVGGTKIVFDDGEVE